MRSYHDSVFADENFWITIAIILVLAICVSGILIGQELRNQRAESVQLGQFTQVITAPEGFDCDGNYSPDQPHIYTVVCEPFR